MRKALKRGGRFLVKPAGRHWTVYVVGCSLLNLWAAVVWGFTSWGPLEAVWTDGSLIVFCFGAMWLTLADLRRELKRTVPNVYLQLDNTQNMFRAWATFASLVAVACYLQFVADKADLEAWARFVISSAALLVGLVYAASAIAVTHEVADGHKGAAE